MMEDVGRPQDGLGTRGASNGRQKDADEAFRNNSAELIGTKLGRIVRLAVGGEQGYLGG